MRIVILDTDSIGTDLDYSLFSSLGDVQTYARTSPDEILDRVKGAECLIFNKVRITREVIEATPTLRLLCVAATGFDNIDVETCRERGVAVSNVVGYSTDAVAELTVSMALALSLRLLTYTAFVSDGSYTRAGLPNCLIPVTHELAGKTWGIYGYGHIGQKVAEIATAMGCKILFYRKTPVNHPDFRDLDNLCRESDILSVHVPLNRDTYHSVDARRLSLMKRDAILINVARGNVLDEEAVAGAIACGTIGGFATDVYSAEPFPPSHPFAGIMGDPRVLLTPHMAWGTYEARTRLISEIEKNLSAFLRGEVRCRVDL